MLTTTAVAYLLLNKKNSQKKTFTDPNVKHALRLIDKKILSHNAKRFKFELASHDSISGLPIGNHIFLSARINNELVVRPYTPISLSLTEGYLEFIIKIYKSGISTKFPNGGKMSQHLDNMTIGRYIDARGPTGHISYSLNGRFMVKENKKAPSKEIKGIYINMIAGGTGITPILQVAQYILMEEKNKSLKFRLVLSNT
ncbi:unnamed protein product, partial [Protopolystoma xenopodis]